MIRRPDYTEITGQFYMRLGNVMFLFFFVSRNVFSNRLTAIAVTPGLMSKGSNCSRILATKNGKRRDRLHLKPFQDVTRSVTGMSYTNNKTNF